MSSEERHREAARRLREIGAEEGAAVAEQLAEEASGKKEPKTYELRGSLRAWIKVELDAEGVATVIGLDFERDFELDPYPGLSFEREGDDEGGRDLTAEEAQRIAEKLSPTGERWKLAKIEDSHGAVYLDG